MITFLFYQEFLTLDENEPEKVTSNIVLDPKTLLSNGDGKEKKVPEKTRLTGLTISNVTASWQPDSAMETLKNITLKAAPGEFIGIAGPVGSGKVRFCTEILKIVVNE